MKKSYIDLAHMADFHLLSRQYGSASRSEDFYQGVRRAVIALAAHTPRVDAALAVGDIFDEPRPTTKIIQQLMRVDALLKSYGLPMLTVTGNHDWASPTWLSTLFPDARFADGGIIPIDGETVEVGGYKITGLVQMSVGTYMGHLKEVNAACEGSDVVLFHALVNGVVPTTIPKESMIDIDDLPYRVKGVKFIALGDVHLTGYVEHGGVLVGYPGSLEMKSKSEPLNKKLPIVRVTESKAEVLTMLDLEIRPFVAKDVHTQADLDVLMAELQRLADKHPVVITEFNRDLPETVTRVFGLLDPQRAIIRLSPAPRSADEKQRERMERGGELTMEYFVRQRFPGSSLVDNAAVDLLNRGSTDAANIVTDFMEARLKELNVREA
jgi:DNA repair exonuclease SbcCD nuclease subunit